MTPITHVAIYFDGVTWSLPAPYRHAHVIHHIRLVTGHGLYGPSTQGFLDQAGHFLNRREAFIRAHQMGQVITRRPEGYQGDSLYSEDLW